MAKRNTQKQRGAAQRRPNEGLIIFAGIGFLILASLVLFFATREGAGQPVRPAMTLDPQITVNLTEMPRATPLSGEEADSWNEFRAMVDACDDYSPERRAQMEQHIAWLLDPSDMPRDVILAMGNNPTERLVFGMATYTSIQWRLNDRPPDSCLIPIGLTLNEILEALGSNPFDIYDEVAGSS
jgi:hypothetical protein